MSFIFADIVDKETRKTFRELNNEKTHKIPVGSLVELSYEEKCDSALAKNGIRLHVIEHSRDCDGTPLYTLGVAGSTWTDKAFVHNGFPGYSEDSLKIIREPTQEVLDRIQKLRDLCQASRTGRLTEDRLERLKG